MELLIGCGNKHIKKFWVDQEEWSDLTTIDIDPNCGADVIHDLNVTPWPFEDNRFSEIHAYEVLEHLGRQGDHRAFFATFYEIWRLLKPDGMLFGTVPSWRSEWAWGDPSHTRVLTPGTMVFLSQEQYRKQVGHTSMTDFRWLWKGDFALEHIEENGEHMVFALRALKDKE